MRELNRPTAMLLAVAAVGTAAPAALGSVRHDTVAPPGVTGCASQPTASEEHPSARLPATMHYHASSARVRGRLHRPSQATKATIHAYRPGGRRIDVAEPQQYTCTAPARSRLIVFRVGHRSFGRLLRRHGNTLRLTVVMRMVNANGRRTTLKRVVTVRPH
jgi:hypothetical protein